MPKAIKELVISKNKGSYYCRFSIRYGVYEVIEDPNPKRILAVVDKKIADGYKIKKESIPYKELWDATRKTHS